MGPVHGSGILILAFNFEITAPNGYYDAKQVGIKAGTPGRGAGPTSMTAEDRFALLEECRQTLRAIL